MDFDTFDTCCCMHVTRVLTCMFMFNMQIITYSDIRTMVSAVFIAIPMVTTRGMAQRTISNKVKEAW